MGTDTPDWARPVEPTVTATARGDCYSHGLGDKGVTFRTMQQHLAGFEAPVEVLEDVLESGRVLSLTGHKGTGKTAVAQVMALHIERGWSIGGKETAGCGVLFLAGENPSDVRTRWAGLLAQYRLTPAQVRIHVVEGTFSLTERINAIGHYLKRFPGIGLIEVDTAQAFYREIGGDDANNNDQQIAAAKAYRAVADLGPCVLILAHPTKSQGAELTPYGGGAFLNEIDGNMSLARGEDDGLLTLAPCVKFRGDFEPIKFALHKMVLSPFTYADANGQAVHFPGFAKRNGKWIKTIRAEPAEVVAEDASDVAESVLRLITEYYDKGVYCSTKTGPNAQGVFRVLGEVEGWPIKLNHTKKVEPLLVSLKAQNRIVEEGYKDESRNWKSRWKPVR